MSCRGLSSQQSLILSTLVSFEFVYCDSLQKEASLSKTEVILTVYRYIKFKDQQGVLPVCRLEKVEQLTLMEAWQ